jgi:tRNA threonylcarbamoyladenosine biosynthesis protein TsaE
VGQSYQSDSTEQTAEIAGQIAKILGGGDCIALIGELGAGKTQFVRGLVAGLGGDARNVSSPTFILLNIYPTPAMKVFHLDAYRVRGADDFAAIGFSELLQQNGLVVVEWADRVADLLPPRRWTIRIDHAGESKRVIHITPPSEQV